MGVGIGPMNPRPTAIHPTSYSSSCYNPPMSEAEVQTSVIYCGDCEDVYPSYGVELKRLPDNCIDLVYLDPPFNSNGNYEVFWGEDRSATRFCRSSFLGKRGCAMPSNSQRRRRHDD